MRLNGLGITMGGFMIDLTIEMKNVVTIPKVNGYSLSKINNDLSDFLKKKGFYVSKHHPKGTALIQHYYKPLSNDYNFEKTYLIQPIDGTTIHKVNIDYINLLTVPSTLYFLP